MEWITRKLTSQKIQHKIIFAWSKNYRGENMEYRSIRIPNIGDCVCPRL